ncbi:acyltransferase 3 [Actinoplanes sp. SE50]|uniref:acyltransferase family protein n=1 Tax=unclassified Actinoplanes TaxID=2626549 RepID=UPI00023EDE4B|nr:MULTISPECIES: acyltransferase family protein [unclassified Actinoplanes]AEV88175.1 acyltransferase 3 [Actinoplanes sp. SE50/110]ATO86580.1 acyltransferase 3 [Actinoplanes sp. SE50]SLM03997.1 acyltransferase [Actinoplanes sp. SE50/110]
MSLSPNFRSDVEGLRAVAVLLVVLGHAGVPFAAGGYVGVDVFFVISGFLITSLLLRERAAGRMSIRRFYARRALRLLPAAALVLVSTLLAARLWLPPIRMGDLARDALSAAGYVANLRFALTGTDYLNADAPPSPFQHFWSLAVEEQFYLIWPLLLMLPRRRPVLIGLVLASFTAGVWETTRSAPWAYFGPHTRAWELGAGALVALFAPKVRNGWLGGAGLAAILGAALWCDDATAYPGFYALLPVAGTTAVLIGGLPLLEARPLQAVGRLSYGWYLWHWPLLLIGPAALGRDPSLPLSLLLAAAGLGLAWVTYHLVENPVRHHPWLRVRTAPALGLGAALSALVAATAVTIALLPHPVPAGAAIRDLRAATAHATDPYAVVTRAVRASRGLRELPANLTPTLARVNQDKARVWADGCHVEAPVLVAPAGCEYGDPGSTTTVVLYGDSHAAQWFPAMDRLAEQHHWRLVSISKSSCSAADLPLWHDGLKREYTECAAFHTSAEARIRALRPALVVIGSSFNYRPVDTRTDEAAQWRAGWQRTFAALGAAKVALIEDTPYLGGERVPVCVARQARLKRINRCGKPATSALRGPAQRSVLPGLTGVTVVDPDPWLCTDFCPPVIGNVLAYRDSNHLTTTFAQTVAPLLDAALPRVQ